MTNDLIAKLREYPLSARIWFRESTDEWVLELSGEFNDCNFTSRHTQPKETPPEDVAGLPSLYAEIATLSANLEAMREALEPFAICADDCDHLRDGQETVVAIHAGAFRKARTSLGDK